MAKWSYFSSFWLPLSTRDFLSRLAAENKITNDEQDYDVSEILNTLCDRCSKCENNEKKIYFLFRHSSSPFPSLSS